MIKTKRFSVKINASPNKIWFSLWNDAHYRNWTSAFCEGSYIKTDWKVGSRAHFLNPKGEGMFSLVIANVPNKKMFFTHLGELKNFEEQPLSEAQEVWTGGRENYWLEPDGENATKLVVEMDIDEQYFPYFLKTFPKALRLVKKIAENLTVKVEATIDAPLETVWTKWTTPEDVKNWNNASPDWHTPRAANDLRVGGRFSYEMAAKDGSFSFDFGGEYLKVESQREYVCRLDDGRKMTVLFRKLGKKTRVVEIFEPESMHPVDFQELGWQAILDNFKNYVEKK